MKRLLFLTLCFSQYLLSFSQTNYIENFDNIGYPSNIPADSYWKFFNDINPNQTEWSKFIPGDGKAYITVDADISNDTDATYPYQTLVFGGVKENHRLEVRMKGAPVDGGLVAFIFTYHQVGSTFNEVDIELVANDKNAAPHETLPPNGWTDARFNTWRDADENTALPFTGSAKAIVDENNKKMSLVDDKFHTYTIDWRADEVDFFIDDVLQESFNTNIAKGWAEVIIGYRHLPWAGEFNWSGNHTMVIDYFKIEPLSSKSILTSDNFQFNENEEIRIFPNPIRDYLNLKVTDENNVNRIEIVNAISSKTTIINKYKRKIDLSTYAKGIYFLKTYLKNGKQLINKIIKI